jgi:glucose-1-phosphate adenylyltransferase
VSDNLDKRVVYRYVSHLTQDTLALVLAGGRGTRLYELTDFRAKPAVHFGGKYRIIDFPLSNCVNSGIRRIGVLTQYKAHSLIRHLVRGWSHFKRELGEYVEILPASQQSSEEWYQGTADAVYQNLDIIRVTKPKFVLILSGDHIYKMDYRSMLLAHVESGADVTISCLEVPIEEAAGAFGVMTVDENNRILRFDEKPEKPTPLLGKPDITLASMGNYIFNTDTLLTLLEADGKRPDSEHDFGKDIIPTILDDHKVYAYPFRDPETGALAYWRDVGSLDAFWEANMELISPNPELRVGPSSITASDFSFSTDLLAHFWQFGLPE